MGWKEILKLKGAVMTVTALYGVSVSWPGVLASLLLGSGLEDPTGEVDPGPGSG